MHPRSIQAFHRLICLAVLDRAHRGYLEFPLSTEKTKAMKTNVLFQKVRYKKSIFECVFQTRRVISKTASFFKSAPSQI